MNMIDNSHSLSKTKDFGKPMIWHVAAPSCVTLLMTLCLVISCSDHDSDGVVDMAKKEIVGKWELVEWPGVDKTLSNWREYYEFSNDGFYTHNIIVKDDVEQQKGAYMFERGWTLHEGELEGYLTMTVIGFIEGRYISLQDRSRLIDHYSKGDGKS